MKVVRNEVNDIKIKSLAHMIQDRIGFAKRVNVMSDIFKADFKLLKDILPPIEKKLNEFI
jgi:hypothetical protein